MPPRSNGSRMEDPDRKHHWENVYLTKPLETVGWYQPVPEISLELISRLELPQDAPVIDIGGGDSLLADHLLAAGHTDITVLDISGAALARARDRLGQQAEKVQWVESDVLAFRPERPYALWHDRAAFHFLTAPGQVARYLECARQGVRHGGYLILGTFSDTGPDTCSGLPVQRYSASELQQTMAPYFEMREGINLPHYTPSGGRQDYTFGVFVRSG